MSSRKFSHWPFIRKATRVALVGDKGRPFDSRQRIQRRSGSALDRRRRQTSKVADDFCIHRAIQLVEADAAHANLTLSKYNLL